MAFVNYRCGSVLDNCLATDLTLLTANPSHSTVLELRFCITGVLGDTFPSGDRGVMFGAEGGSGTDASRGLATPSFFAGLSFHDGNVIGLARDLDPVSLQVAAGVGSTTTGRDV